MSCDGEAPSVLRRLLANLGLSAASLLIAFLAIELIVFRLLLPASDWPELAEGDAVVRYRPNQSGTYRVRDEIEARYRINAQGWSSHHSAYSAVASPLARRIAVVGDSYVEAFQVTPERSVSARIRHISGPTRPTSTRSE